MTLLETHLPLPTFGFGLIAIVCFLIALVGVLAVGKGRPHS